MAQKLLASFRKLPGQRKRPEQHGYTSTDGEIIRLNKCGDFGFPMKPSSMCYDSVSDFFALVSRTGVLKIFGRPGVEFSACHENEAEVVKVSFIPGQLRLVTLTGENSIHLWALEPGSQGRSAQLREVAHLVDVAALIDSRASTPNITCLQVSKDGASLLLGSEGGCVALVEIPAPNETTWRAPTPEDVIDPPRVARSFDAQYRKMLKFGAIMSLIESPSTPGQLLIGYSSGLGVVYHLGTDKPVCLLPGQRELESACWLEPWRITTSHDDGSLILWSIEDVPRGGEATQMRPPNMPYGPFPCKAISKLIWRHTSKGELFIFSGGMPRSTYGDKDTVSLLRGEEDHLCLDLTSQVVDLLCLPSDPSREPHTLLILLTEELVAVDLLSRNWPLIPNPYLNCLHSSAVTCTAFITQVEPSLISKLRSSGLHAPCSPNVSVLTTDTTEGYSHSMWPLSGGQCLPVFSPASGLRDLVLTGHEDGSVSFWMLSAGGCIERIYQLHTAILFEGDFPLPVDNTMDADDISEWPPFRRTGVFDPFSDDIRLGVTTLDLVDGHLIVGGNAGQVTVWRFRGDNTSGLSSATVDVKPANMEQLGGKMTPPLKLRSPPEHPPDSCMKPEFLLQLLPPSRVTAVAWETQRRLLAAGNAYGLAIATKTNSNNNNNNNNMASNAMATMLGGQESTVTGGAKILLARCTLLDTPGAADVAEGWTRRRTRELKKSLRDSFRRLRRLRSTHGATMRKTARGPDRGGAGDDDDELELAHVEREVDVRGSTSNPTSSAIRSLHFAPVYLKGAPGRKTPTRSHTEAAAAAVETAGGSGLNSSPVCFLAGTGAGLTMVYAVSSAAQPQVLQWKELQLRHMAPVLEVIVLDAKTHAPLTDAKATGTSQEVLVVTEEQVRLFSFPALHLKQKARITAKDGFRIKRASVVSFGSVSGDSRFGSTGSRLHHHSIAPENPCVLLANNGGQVVVLDLPNLRKLSTSPLVHAIDVLAINSLVLAQGKPPKNSKELTAGASAPLGIYQTAPGQISLFELVPAHVRSKAGVAGAPYTAQCSLSAQSPMSHRSTTEGATALRRALGDVSIATTTGSSAADSGLDSSLPDSVREFNTSNILAHSSMISSNTTYTSSRDGDHHTQEHRVLVTTTTTNHHAIHS